MQQIWFGTRAVSFLNGGSTGPQHDLVETGSQFATRTTFGQTGDFTGAEWQQLLAFTGTQQQQASIGINLSNGVDRHASGQANTTGDLRVGDGVVAHNLADMAGGSRISDVTGTLDSSNDPVAISGFGRLNSTILGGTISEGAASGNYVTFSDDTGFGMIQGSGWDPGGAGRLNDGEAITFEIKQGRQLAEASFTVKVVNSGSTAVVLDSDGRTMKDINGAGLGGFRQDESAGELNLGVLAHGAKVKVDFLLKQVWIDGAAFAGDTTAFFAAFADNGKDKLTFGSVVGNTVGWSVDDLVLTTKAPNEFAPVVAAPIADQSVAEDSAWSFQVPAGTFADLDGTTLTLSATLAGGAPLPSWISFDAGTRTFSGTPPQDFNGVISLEVTASDGANSATDGFDLVVTPVNDAPVANGFTGGSGNEDTAITGTVLANDVDGDTLSYAIANGQGPSIGSVVLNPATGGFTYTPNANVNGSDSFTVTISDGQGGTATQLVAIAIAPVNDAPVANGFTGGSGNEDTAITGTVLASDVDGDTLSYGIANGHGPGAGSVVLNPATGGFTYTPNANVNGSDSFTVTISDGQGGTATQLVAIAIVPVNDAPTVTGVTQSATTTTEDGPSITGTVVGADLDGDALTFSVVGAAVPGLTLNPNGSFTFNPAGLYESLNNGQSATASFQVQAFDGTVFSAAFTVPITVTGVTDNRAPVGVADTLIVSDGSLVTIPVSVLLANDTDLDNNTLSITAVAGATNISNLTLSGTNISFNSGNLNSGSFNYTVSDGQGGTATASVSVRKVQTNGSDNGINIVLLEGSYAASFIEAENGNDTVTGTNTTVINGGTQRDWLIGGSGDDQLSGGTGADSLVGNDGNDRLRGGSGNDSMTGGAGEDWFFLENPTVTGIDRITDFGTGGNDKITLLQGGGGWNAPGTNPAAGLNNAAQLGGGAYQVRSAIDAIATGDNNKVVEISSVEVLSQILSRTGAAVNAYVLLFNDTIDLGQIWWDSNWSNTEDRVLVATLDNLTTLSSVTALGSQNFAEWVV